MLTVKYEGGMRDFYCEDIFEYNVPLFAARFGNQPL
jgi:hypothetical protein